VPRVGGKLAEIQFLGSVRTTVRNLFVLSFFCSRFGRKAGKPLPDASR